MKTFLLLLVLLKSSTAFAAPFCTIFSYGKQCYYYDYESCKEAAGSSGACVINQEEAKPPRGNAPFCVLQSYGTQCFYYDAESCRMAAGTAGACVVNPNR